MKNAKQIIESLLSSAGININGNKPYDIKVHNEKLYGRIINSGSLGLGEAYMEGWWDCEQLDEFFNKVLLVKLDDKIKNNLGLFFELAWNSIINRGIKSKAFEIGIKHYDIGNDLYKAMLDDRLTYTCGYWKEAKNLNEAQTNKLDLICKKIGLKSSDKVLDIGSGWGSFIGFANEKYGANAVGATVSKEQKKLTDIKYNNKKVKTELKDYRDLNEKFDHIVSVGMFEHVGHKNYRNFMKIVHKTLKNDGLFLLHTIGGNISAKNNDPWIEKYIFPNSMLPSMKQITSAIEGLFFIEDLHNFGIDYEKTLMAWYDNFNKNWENLKNNYDEKFYRMWKYYLLSCAGTFRSRRNQLWQIVLSKNGVKGGYKSVR